MLLNQNNYFSTEANQRFMSSSQYRGFQKCQAATVAEIKGEYVRPDTPALMHGRYVDAYISGELDDFLADNPQLISSRGATKGQLKAEYRDLQKIIDRFERDPLFMSYLQGDTQVVLTGQIGGVEFKGKVDILHAERIVDFKTTRDFNGIWDPEEGRRVTFVEFYGYLEQAAIYQELVRQKTGQKRPCYIAAVTKEAVPDLDVLSIPDEILEVKLQEIEHWAVEYDRVKKGAEAERCEKCDYCKETKKLTAARPYWEVSR